MKPRELRDLSVDELAGKEKEFREEEFKTSFQTRDRSIGKDRTPQESAKGYCPGENHYQRKGGVCMTNSSETRKQRKVRTGVVISNKMDKTVVVEVSRTVIHPVYKKFVRRRKRFMAHDEENRCRIGDEVMIVETRPLSRHKNWRVRRSSRRRRCPEVLHDSAADPHGRR